MAKKKIHPQYYFSPRIQKQLALIPRYPLTVVEAPSGFGKTTAVREYLASIGKGEGKQRVLKRWYTCFGESPEKTWSGICNLFRKQDGAMTDALADLGVPSLENLPDVTALLQQYHSSQMAYLVIDNYQLFATTVQKELLAAFAAYQNKKLRIIVITQHLASLSHAGKTTHSSETYHTITDNDFAFDKAGIVDYCQLAGIAITADKIEHIQAACQGWIAAIRLQLKHFQETGRLVGPKGISELVETAVWNKLPAKAKEFMLGVSLLDGVTRQQAVIMNGGAAVPKEASDLRAVDFFVRRVPDKKNSYFLHAILRDYLQEQFAGQSQSFKHTMLGRAAAACQAEGDYCQAALFFMRVADYDSILAMPLTDQYFFNHQGKDIIQFFSRLFRECPPKTLLRHPLMVITVGIQFYKKGMREDYLRALQLMEEFFKTPPGPAEMPERELYRVKGEFEMLRFMLCYNDVVAMNVHHKKAHEYLSHVSVPPRSRLFEGNLPWAAGIPSVLSAYWRQSGELQDMLAALDECLPFYTELVGGHGAGGEIAMRAEAAFVRGDDLEAEVLCYKTLYAAQKRGQTSSCLCAELTLARIGILRGDEKLYTTACKDIVGEMERARQTALTRESEICFAHLDLAFGKTDDLPDWLHSLEAIRRTFYRLTQPHAIMLHCWMLLLEKRWAELYALIEMTIPTTRAMHFALLQVYHLIFLARAAMEEKRDTNAAVYLREALAIALPDRVYLPFAEHCGVLLPLLEKVKNDFDGQRMEECLSLCHRWAKGTAVLRKTLSVESRVLTSRQAEFLSMAAEGNSNAQIAARFGVSSDNVNKVLRSAYVKLNVRNRTEAGAYFLRSTKQGI